jgi:hypothetical protein
MTRSPPLHQHHHLFPQQHLLLPSGALSPARVPRPPGEMARPLRQGIVPDRIAPHGFQAVDSPALPLVARRASPPVTQRRRADLGGRANELCRSALPPPAHSQRQWPGVSGEENHSLFCASLRELGYCGASGDAP